MFADSSLPSPHPSTIHHAVTTAATGASNHLVPVLLVGAVLLVIGLVILGRDVYRRV